MSKKWLAANHPPIITETKGNSCNSTQLTQLEATQPNFEKSQRNWSEIWFNSSYISSTNIFFTLHICFSLQISLICSGSMGGPGGGEGEGGYQETYSNMLFSRHTAMRGKN